MLSTNMNSPLLEGRVSYNDGVVVTFEYSVAGLISITVYNLFSITRPRISLYRHFNALMTAIYDRAIGHY